jgi:hypothetical protein
VAKGTYKDDSQEQKRDWSSHGFGLNTVNRSENLVITVSSSKFTNDFLATDEPLSNFTQRMNGDL